MYTIKGDGGGRGGGEGLWERNFMCRSYGHHNELPRGLISAHTYYTPSLFCFIKKKKFNALPALSRYAVQEGGVHGTIKT